MWLFYATVSLNEGYFRSKRRQTVEFNGDYNHTKFEIDWVQGCPAAAKVKDNNNNKNKSNLYSAIRH